MNTVFFSGNLKRGKTPEEFFDKIKTQIKKKGPTSKWELNLVENKIVLDFKDEISEIFVLEFGIKNAFEGFCKIAFEPGTDGQFEALFDMLYKAKSFYKEISFSDDFGLAENYWNSKQYKFVFRELSGSEAGKVMAFVNNGGTSHEEMLRSFMAEDMGMPLEEYRTYINPKVVTYNTDSPKLFANLESYLYETASFSGERLCEMAEWKYSDLGSVAFSVFAFLEGITWVFLDGSGYCNYMNKEKKRAFSQKDAQVGLLFREKFIPPYEAATDNTEKLMLVYRYFLSVYDFLGFHFEGRNN